MTEKLVDLNQKIKSTSVRIIAFTIVSVFVLVIFVGIFTKKITHIWGVEFNTDTHDTIKPSQNTIVENKADVIINNHNGDIIKDSAVKIVIEK